MTIGITYTQYDSTIKAKDFLHWSVFFFVVVVDYFILWVVDFFLNFSAVFWIMEKSREKLQKMLIEIEKQTLRVPPSIFVTH